MAPEYSIGKAINTVKADIYSFGVVLLKIVSGTEIVSETNSEEYTPNQEVEFLLDKVSGFDRINPLSFFFYISYYQTKHVLPPLNNLWILQQTLNCSEKKFIIEKDIII